VLLVDTIDALMDTSKGYNCSEMLDTDESSICLTCVCFVVGSADC